MPVLLGAVLILGLVAATVAALVAMSVHASVEKLRQPDLPRLDPQDPDFLAMGDEIAEEMDWADEQGFQWLGAFRFDSMLVGAWASPEQGLYFCKYIHPMKSAIDFVTTWGRHVGLTTSSTRDAFTLPHPQGWHVQAFEDLHLGELYRRHMEGVQHLANQLGNRPELPVGGFDALVREKVRQQAEYVSSIPMYPVRGIYWYFVRRGSMVGKPIDRKAA